MNQTGIRRINCARCIYYYVTWDPKHPKGCKYFGFKSTQMPSQVVLKSAGEPCNMFTPKEPKEQA